MSEEKKESKTSFSFLKNWSFLKKIKQVKHIGLIITIIFVLILLIILFGDFNFSFLSGASSKSVSTNASANQGSTYTTSSAYASILEDKLKTLISNINGSGNVQVMISLDGTYQTIIASNDETITTKNSKGEEITTVSATPVIIQQNGTGNPVIVGEVLPEVVGVVVVSSGAKDISVKLNIIDAVKTLLLIDESKILVLVGN